jgi:uncharacterized protein (TIGR00251 family)
LSQDINKTKDGIKLSIRVIPGSFRCEIVGFIEKELKIKLDVPPIEGKANEKCVKFLSKQLGVPKTSISILSGEKSRSKILFIKGNPDEIESQLHKLLNDKCD